MTTFAPIAPVTSVPPTQVARDTFVIHSVQQALGEPLFIYLNSMVILGKEPVIVDTGTIANRTRWLEDVFSLVEPTDGARILDELAQRVAGQDALRAVGDEHVGPLGRADRKPQIASQLGEQARHPLCRSDR